jgi:NDP-sugar pyrophosphorylase family protein
MVLKLTISKEEKPLGTAGPVKLVKEQLTEPFLVMNGDILTQLPYRKLYDFAISKESLLTICTKEIVTPFQFGNIHTEGDFVTGIEEKPDFRTTILAGIYIFKPEILSLIPDNEYFGMDSLIRKMIDLSLPITHYPMRSIGWISGRPRIMRKLRKSIKRSLNDTPRMFTNVRSRITRMWFRVLSASLLRRFRWFIMFIPRIFTNVRTLMTANAEG